MKKMILSVVLMATALVSFAANDEARLLRFPAVGGETIVFSYAGNLYSVGIDGGTASKLTSHVGYEVFPRISPDGKTIAFTAQYDGNTEVYTMPITGGEPKRITYTAKVERDNVGERMGPNNIVMCWSPDGKYIVFRNKQWCFSGLRAQLQKVSAEGGVPFDIPTSEGGFCSYSPDGKYLVMNRMFREFRTWKYYKGGQADDIWIHKVGTASIERLEGCSPESQDIFPMWIGDQIYYFSDRDRTMNMFVYDTKTKKTEKVTSFTEYDCKFPSFSKDYVVFENGGYIYKYSVADKSCTKVNITLNDDDLFSRAELMNVGGQYDSYSLSPDGEKVLVTARGDVFMLPVKNGAVKNLTRSCNSHEREVEWSPDGKSFAYFSDADGEYQVYVASAENPLSPKKMTSFTSGYPRDLVWSPDSKFIYFSGQERCCYALDVASGKLEKILESKTSTINGFRVSPAGEWAAYSRQLENKSYAVFLYELATGKSYQVTSKWYDAYSFIFSEDGKYLFFTSPRDFKAQYSRVEWNAVYNLNDYIFMVDLSQKKDFELHTKALPEEAGHFRLVYADKEKLYYSSKNSLKTYEYSTEKIGDGPKHIPMTFTTDHKKVLVREEGKLYVTDFKGGSLGDALPVDKMQMWVDHKAEWKQIFDESWRVTRDGFYVENMHGVDWKAMHDKYGQMLPYVNHRHDLTYLIGEMIAELSIGHAYITSGDAPSVPVVKTGLLGARFSKVKEGFRIDHIFKGADWDKSLLSPLDKGKANVGDVIVEIDGVSANEYPDILAALVGKAEQKVELKIKRKGEISTIEVKTISDESELAYYQWVQGNIEKVEKATNGEIGYIHIPDMSTAGLDMFTKLFYTQLDKKALIIDDRMNGGGNVSPIILERLLREAYRVSMYRNGANEPVPNESFNGPKVCLIDKYSSSDGDLFPYGFRKTGLGKLIGKRSWGGIVGISGSKRFLDGQDMRTPFFTSYSTEGEWIIEGYGVDPDIDIDINPFEDYKGKDAQLDKAIEVLKEELKNYKELPGTPEAPVKNASTWK